MLSQHRLTTAARRLALAPAMAAAVLVLNGCTATGQASAQMPTGIQQADYEVARGQSLTPHQEGTHRPLGNAVNNQLNAAISPKGKDHIPHYGLKTAVHDHLYNTQVGYYDASQPICGGTGQPGDPMCPSCPTCPGAGPLGGHFGGCPGGQCGGCGSGQCVRHYHSYRVEQPKNLVYPQPNAVGGATVYPYYTHKGPSDFFRD